MSYFEGHYVEWREARFRGLKKYIPDSYFQGKTLLEMGCGYGHIGNTFSQMGADVTCVTADSEQIRILKEKFPHLKSNVFDAETGILEKSYDVILHWGLLYHLSEIENHIAKLSDKCNVLILETEICDSNDENFYVSLDEVGYDQAWNQKGIRPSPPYVEKVLKANGFQYKMILDSDLNGTFHNYNAPILNTRTTRNGFRRFWICWKDGHSPL